MTDCLGGVLIKKRLKVPLSTPEELGRTLAELLELCNNLQCKLVLSLDNSLDGILVLDQNLVLLDCNTAAEKLLEIARADHERSKSSTLTKYVPAESASTSSSDIARA